MSRLVVCRVASASAIFRRCNLTVPHFEDILHSSKGWCCGYQLNGFATSRSSWISNNKTSGDNTTNNRTASTDKEDHSDEEINEHFKLDRTRHPLGESFGKKHKIKEQKHWDNPVPHQIYSSDELSSVKQTHKEPQVYNDKVALFAVKLMRGGFDFVSRYKGAGGEMTKKSWLNRCLFLETVAGVPGMVAGMARHLKSLRSMKRDYGWIHTLLAEAENERMHLLIFMKLKDPGIFFRTMVILGQGVFFNAFFLTYLVSPRTCHRFVGYLEEEAVKTYTGLLKDIGESGHLRSWGSEPAHNIAIRYYKLQPDAKVRDVVECIRADEATHRDVNHTFAELDQQHDPNPYIHKHKT